MCRNLQIFAKKVRSLRPRPENTSFPLDQLVFSEIPFGSENSKIALFTSKRTFRESATFSKFQRFSDFMKLFYSFIIRKGWCRTTICDRWREKSDISAQINFFAKIRPFPLKALKIARCALVGPRAEKHALALCFPYVLGCPRGRSTTL